MPFGNDKDIKDNPTRGVGMGNKNDFYPDEPGGIAEDPERNDNFDHQAIPDSSRQLIVSGNNNDQTNDQTIEKFNYNRIANQLTGSKRKKFK